jgi:acyl-homoserine-lactone acylase
MLNTLHRSTGLAVRLQHAVARFALASALVLSPAARASADPPLKQAARGVEVRRTIDGIAHLRADGWRDLGYGVGYVQAEDALCTLAEAFVTYEGRRSYFFGAEAKPALDSSLGRPKNLDSDLFFRAFADDHVIAQYRAVLPEGLNEMIEGFAAGYNRYLKDLRVGVARSPEKACRDAVWVREIERNDIYRRMYAAQIAAGYARFIPALVNAQPDVRRAAQTPGNGDALRSKLAYRVGGQAGLGSNALAFGRRATGEEGGVLFGNPHWYWGGPDRFYQMHLTIPGRLDVAGVAFLGIPVVMIGFNEHVAWSHTVSEARRFGLFDLKLEAADPTRYRVDGKVEPMQSRHVTVPVRSGDSKSGSITRTLYRTRFGPMLDLREYDAAFGWGSEHALSMRDVNADNFRVFRNFFFWNQARSLDEFIEIQRREAAVPWANTVAIGRGDGRVWYADVGPVPNVPDALRADCSTPLAESFAQLDALTPFLDASRSRCAWKVDARAVQPGAMPAAAMPSLLREDYVANMNDSYWLSNVQQPLEGYPAVLGGERRPLSLRSRLGHQIALHAQSDSAQALSRRLMQQVLAARVHSAELFKHELLAGACAHPEVEVGQDVLGDSGKDAEQAPKAAPESKRKVNVVAACRILRRWSNSGNAGDRGALLWDAMWAQLSQIPEAELYRVPFASAAPLETPRAPNADDPRIAQALAAAVVSISRMGWALDAPVGSQRYVLGRGEKLPLYGGCHAAGYFTVACNDDGSYPMGPSSCANSYLQVVHFTARGVEAHTLLAHGQQETALQEGEGRAPVVRYARKQWLRFPFTEQEIARDPKLVRFMLRP